MDTEAKTENEKALNVSARAEFTNRQPSDGGRAWHCCEAGAGRDACPRSHLNVQV